MAWRSRTSSFRSRPALVALVALLGLLGGCSGKADAIAELAKADGPVERQAGGGAWAPAAIGTKYYVGDAARTGAGGAQLEIVAGGGTLAMQPHTVLRFGGGGGGGGKTAGAERRLTVELGAVDLSG